jgi:hypothetical protein
MEKDIVFIVEDSQKIDNYLTLMFNKIPEFVEERKRDILEKNGIEYDDINDYYITPLGYKNSECKSIQEMFKHIMLPIFIYYDIKNNHVISYNSISSYISNELERIPMVIYDKHYNEILTVYNIKEYYTFLEQYKLFILNLFSDEYYDITMALTKLMNKWE